MADKLRRTIPIKITFSEGERPTASKLSAVADQSRKALNVVEKAIGDIWNQSGDPLLISNELQIPNLGRMIGEARYLNPVMYSLIGSSDSETPYTFKVTETVSSIWGTGATSGYFKFLPAGEITASSIFTTLVASEDLVLIAGDYYIDSFGKWKTFSPLSGTVTVTYDVQSSDGSWAKNEYNRPNIIPDPRQLTFTGCRVSTSSSKYFLHLPPRRPLDFDNDFEITSNYPTIDDYSLNEATSIDVDNLKLWQSSSIDALAHEHYRYSLPEELRSQIDNMVAGDLFPAGALYLWDLETNTLVENVTFSKPTVSPYDEYNWVLEIASDSIDFSGKVTADESESSYSGTSYALIVVGSSLSRSLYWLSNAFQMHSHDNSGDFSKPISHNSLTLLNPPAYTFASHQSHYPSNAQLQFWPKSRWAGDDHTYLLSRAGAQGLTDGTYRDANDNAMLGDLLLSSTVLSGGNYLNLLGTSNRIFFGKRDTATAPYIYADTQGTINMRNPVVGGAILNLTGLGGLAVENGLFTEATYIGGSSGNTAFSASTYCWSLESLTINPLRSALHIEPQNPAPTGYDIGDIYINSEGRLNLNNGTNFNILVGKEYGISALSNIITSTAAETVFSNGTFTIPENTLKAGSVMKIRLTVKVTNQTGSPTLNIRLRYNGLSGTLLFATGDVTVATNDYVIMDVWLLWTDTAGVVNGGGNVFMGVASNTLSATTMRAVAFSVLSHSDLATTSNKSLVVTGDFSASSSSNVCRLETFFVEIA